MAPVVALLLASKCAALGPHEILVLANETSVDSIEIAKEYCRLRGVPAANLARVRVAAPQPGKPWTIAPDDFRRTIWDAAWQQAQARGVSRQILAWAYSVDFPTRVTTPTNMSVTGYTFVRARPPPMQQVGEGSYSSPLFSGPGQPGGPAALSQSLDVFAEWLREDMPLPAMMLGVTGERGNTRDEVKRCLRAGAASDGTAPGGTVYFVTNQDIRSTTREWQFPDTVRDLGRAGVRALIVNQFPSGQPAIAGLMCGTASVAPASCGHYLPGAMAEHFTSAAGAFDSPNQTKLTAWIAAGATASAGTVTEPFAIWTKFPHARFFVHYAAGCTAMESFYQSLRCPLQILPVGDPLARPWAPNADVSIRRTDRGEGGTLTFQASVESAPEQYPRIEYLLDGRALGRGPGVGIPAASLERGQHTLRAVAYRAGMVRCQSFAELNFNTGVP
jgi:uncharacterized protein (TIGR03790 family)